MKTIIALTDFSPNATHAAHYAFQLANSLKANLVLCNAYLVPAEIPSAYTIAWPIEEYNLLSEESVDMLKLLKEQLETWAETLQNTDNFTPQIAIHSSFGAVSSVIKELVPANEISMIVAGTHESSFLGDVLSGNNVNIMINNIDLPLLLIPPNAAFKNIEKVAFATDLKFAAEDVTALKLLNTITEQLNATVMLANIYDEQAHTPLFEKCVKDSLDALISQGSFEKMSSKTVIDDTPERGLQLLCNEEKIDVLAMVHHDLNTFQRMFKGSHTKSMLALIDIPLLIFNTRSNAN
ncbi:universal stress protein [Mucilaginibacter flavus]|uniref:universal stress protein n=1 Tax=Mucilaginibacter flavus TaxID=931504 RepID=UPI0025B5B674|nr:universal stress protein [Mucilaginibacter flavus]MDN3584248.1 universal stress protein [Mucilaginibacter flavus]